MASIFRPATELLVQYARYHRDRRNIVTHFVGVPIIVFAIGVLLSRPTFAVAALALTPAWILWGAAAAWYLSRGHVTLGVATAAAIALLVALSQPIGSGSTAAWLGWGMGLFVAGWAIQFLGHYYEGRKPAFVDDFAGLLVAPMFITAEGLFALGWGRRLLDEIERGAGPTHLRDLHVPSAR